MTFNLTNLDYSYFIFILRQKISEVHIASKLIQITQSSHHKSKH